MPLQHHNPNSFWCHGYFAIHLHTFCYFDLWLNTFYSSLLEMNLPTCANSVSLLTGSSQVLLCIVIKYFGWPGRQQVPLTHLGLPNFQTNRAPCCTARNLNCTGLATLHQEAEPYVPLTGPLTSCFIVLCVTKLLNRWGKCINELSSILCRKPTVMLWHFCLTS